ncbi:MsnO8 family LLM class oxidoreductase [Neomegalonema sp.]|uniref:MsnO8 family LLM class oxidoreductase n=1 Tax=Neomegalonema sp. TaxID=2039713 RepID=UPI002631A69D|nr:MsnO8 family LLM class oxidoreductase [Neomegalonema sp.]MDD2867392.1 MsnO8 family LLM class oxidoreductase [Neomegalonema sp.]
MGYEIGLLDKSPVAPGASPAEALALSVAYARRADELGYSRLWLAEHHGFPGLASAAPEVLAAHLLARTRRIRIGSGGVLLQHYSPYKVAEIFGVLASLAPGRVDLGIGKSPGGFPFSTQALRGFASPAAPREDFARRLTDLDAWLRGAPPEGAPAAEALPRAEVLPERILLGASVESAELAARLGWSFTYAGHHDGDPAAVERSLAAYEAIAGERPKLALLAVVARSQAEAERLAEGARVFRLTLPNGHGVNLGSPEGAEEYARQLGAEDFQIVEKRPEALVGTPEKVRARLDELSRRFGVKEFILDSPIAEAAPRLAAIELLAGVPAQAAA